MSAPSGPTGPDPRLLRARCQYCSARCVPVGPFTVDGVQHYAGVEFNGDAYVAERVAALTNEQVYALLHAMSGEPTNVARAALVQALNGEGTHNG